MLYCTLRHTFFRVFFVFFYVVSGMLITESRERDITESRERETEEITHAHTAHTLRQYCVCVCRVLWASVLRVTYIREKKAGPPHENPDWPLGRAKAPP